MSGTNDQNLWITYDYPEGMCIGIMVSGFNSLLFLRIIQNKMVPHIFMIIFYLYLINRMLRRSILIGRVMFFKHNFTKGLVSEMLDASGTLGTSEKTLVQAGLS